MRSVINLQNLQVEVVNLVAPALSLILLALDQIAVIPCTPVSPVTTQLASLALRLVVGPMMSLVLIQIIGRLLSYKD